MSIATSRLRARTRQRGLTLVELMVALVIGLILTAVVLQVYLSTKDSYRVQEGLSRLQENARFASDLMAQALRLTGYKSDPVAGDETVFPADGTFLSAAQVIAGGDNDVNGVDSITFRYEGSNDGSVEDCLGRLVSTGDIAVNTYRLSAQSELECNSVNPTAAPATQATSLIGDVEDMEILYGVDSTGDRSVNKYVNAAAVTAANEWGRVMSLRVALLLRSDDNIAVQPQQYTFNGITTTPSDRRVRRVFTSTINLRSQTP